MTEQSLQGIIRNLTEKVGEKRRQAATDLLEQIVIWKNRDEKSNISESIKQLSDFIRNRHQSGRRGVLLGLAAVAVGLQDLIQLYQGPILESVINCFDDPEPSIRYFACETLYNVAHVSRGFILIFIRDIFSAICKLIDDKDSNVRKVAHLVDTHLKDIVTENSSSPNFRIDELVQILSSKMGTEIQNQQKLIVSWIETLNSIPNVDLLQFLPQLIDGLFRFLSSPNEEVQSKANILFIEFKNEMTNRAKSKISNVNYSGLIKLLTPFFDSKEILIVKTAINWINEIILLGKERVLSDISELINVILPCLSSTNEDIKKSAFTGNEKLKELIGEISTDQIYTKKESQNFHQMNTISNLENNQDEKEKNMENLQDDEDIKKDLGNVVPNEENFNQENFENDKNDKNEKIAFERQPNLPEKKHKTALYLERSLSKLNSSQDSIEEECRLDPYSIIHMIPIHFASEFSQTKIEALRWIGIIYEKKAFEVSEELFNSLLQLLKDVSHKVVLFVIDVLCNFCGTHSDNLHFFMKKLIGFFEKNTKLLEHRGIFIIRRICKLLDSIKVFVSLATNILFCNTLHFSQLMIRNLNLMLFTSPELSDLRRILIESGSSPKTLQDTSEDDDLFCTLFRSWCVCPASTLGLCLLHQKYNLAGHISQTISKLPVDLSLLLELDKLVQLLETPVFAMLRVHLLEAEKYQSLVRCLYSIFVQIPQSRSFNILDNRLNSVTRMIFFDSFQKKSSDKTQAYINELENCFVQKQIQVRKINVLINPNVGEIVKEEKNHIKI
ncbi:tax1 binding protein-related [Anaeramoeba ignava]|uniref:Tax1 binding protein-related n=1 Tax=Anaeramoeba ignava TaxID=1746090 RepID=A0A9Q0L6W6_ANAIG|nr:tax1 binding protein-related [Anaeramoeba ignava]